MPGRFSAARISLLELDDLGLLAREARLFIQSAATTMLRAGGPVGLDLIVELARCRRIEQLNIVTLNHDTLVERLLEESSVKLTDGFGPADGDVRWYDDQLYDGRRASTRLFKVHGSVSWYRFVVDGLPRTAVVRRNGGDDLFDAKGKQLTRWIQDASFNGRQQSDPLPARHLSRPLVPISGSPSRL